MSSPINIPFSQFIKIDRRQSDPIYLQIVYQFIQAVQRQFLSDGDLLPGSRQLSKTLGIHRKTLVKALKELQFQGWIETVPNVGTYIKNPELKKLSKNRSSLHSFLPDKADFSFRRSYILDELQTKKETPLRFTDGKPDFRVIKAQELGRFYSSVLNRKNSTEKTSATAHLLFFKKQLSFYLNSTRGLHCSHENILTANNHSVLLYILTQLLIRKGDTVLVADYSLPFANMVFQQAGAKVETIPLDKEGILIDAIKKNYKRGEIRLLYLQSQCQYPTTISLSTQRQKKLLQLAESLNFIIIEDGIHDELIYKKHTQFSLIQQNRTGNVIYMGNFGEFLHQGFQTSFVLGPSDFIKEADKYLSIFNDKDAIKTRALGEMIYEGDIHRYRRKALRVYESRRDFFIQLIETYFPHVFRYDIPAGGLALWLEFRKPLLLSELNKACIERGLLLSRTCLYQNRKMTALRLGFGQLNNDEMTNAIKILHQAVDLCSQSNKI